MVFELEIVRNLIAGSAQSEDQCRFRADSHRHDIAANDNDLGTITGAGLASVNALSPVLQFFAQQHLVQHLKCIVIEDIVFQRVFEKQFLFG